METFRRLFMVALFAGVIAGLFVTAVHQVSTVPVILDAETYENAGEAAAPPAHTHDATGGTALAATDEQAAAGHEHEHEEGGWSPSDGLERTLFTGGADILTGVGFALLLVAIYVFSGRRLDWRSGLFWGLAGFATVTLAPGLGLPPEVPGTEAAPLMDRQIWWVATAILTGGGLALIFFGRSVVPVLAGVVLIVLPHAYGAPQPVEYASAAPEALAQRFIVAVTVSSLLFWAALGTLTGFFYSRTFKPA